MIALDTNYIVRFLTRDIELQFRKAKKVISDEESEKFISSVVLAEAVYILENHYKLDKHSVINTLIDLLDIKHIKSPKFLKRALLIYKKESVSFYDSIIIAETIESSHNLKTFDIKLEKIFDRITK